LLRQRTEGDSRVMGRLAFIFKKALTRVARNCFNKSPERSKTYSIGKSTVKIGAYTYGFEHLEVREWGEGADLNIGSFCSLADRVQIFLGGNHRTDWVSTFPFSPDFASSFGGTGFVCVGHPATKGSVEIGNDVWIGSGATILSGLTIGDGAVIAANSTVTRSIGPYEIWAGNPAKLVSLRFDTEIVEKLLILSWWSLPIVEIKRFAERLSAPPESEFLDSLIQTYRANNV
jgi:acetyltransferase-like isoleucine patch superfamily enzyme